MPYRVAVISRPEDDRCDRLVERIAQLGHEPIRFPPDDTLAAALMAARTDVACTCLRGVDAKDGAIESLLDVLRIPFIGSSSRARAQAHDRSTLAPAVGAFALIGGGGLSSAHVPGSVPITRRQYRELGLRACIDAVARLLPAGYPVAVRTLHQGAGNGSCSIRAVQDEAALRDALDEVLACDAGALVQEWVDGVHVSTAVLGQGPDAYAFPPVGRGASSAVPVELAALSADESGAQAIRSELERAAVEAHNAYGAQGFSQIDLAWDGARACVLEVNLAPRLEEDSPFALSCAVAGVTLDALFAELLDQAVACAQPDLL